MKAALVLTTVLGAMAQASAFVPSLPSATPVARAQVRDGILWLGLHVAHCCLYFHFYLILLGCSRR